MPRYRRRLTTLAALKDDTALCGACHQAINHGEPVSWTWTRRRIHESCIPIWAFADRGRRPFGSWVVPVVAALLSRHGGRLCAGCLALGLSLSLEEARAVVAITGGEPGFKILPVTCGTCSRETDVLCVVPPGEQLAESSPGDADLPKCGQTISSN